MSAGTLAAMDPHDCVMRLARGHVAARAVFATVQLRIPDHLAERPRTAPELAALTGGHTHALLRLPRGLTAFDLCTKDTEQRFSLTSAGEALRTDAPRHAASAIRQIRSAAIWKAFGDFLHCVTTGQPALETTGGAPVFSGLSADQAARLSEAMIAYYGNEPAAVSTAYDFSGIGTLVDVGGSTGNLLTLSGLPRDQRLARGQVPGPSATRPARYPRARTPSDRRATDHAGPRFRSGEISRSHCLTVSGGMHRTKDEHGALMAAAGFQQTRVVPTDAQVTLIEGRPV